MDMNKCSCMGCNREATSIIDANDSATNKYLACNDHQTEMTGFITAQGINRDNIIVENLKLNEVTLGCKFPKESDAYRSLLRN